MKTIITFKSLFEIDEHIDKLVGDFQEITGDCVDTITNVVIKDIQLIWDEPKELNAADLYFSTYQRPVSLPYYVYIAEAAAVRELDRVMRITDEVLRHMIIRKD